MKRLFKYGALGVVVLAVAVGAIAYFRPEWIVELVGRQRIEDWIATTLRNVAEEYLEPTTEFTGLRYEFPATITLENLSLKSGDVTIAEAASATLAVTDVPRPGKPFIIQSIALVDPVFRFVEDEEGVVGWGNLVKSEEDAAKDAPSGEDERTPLSDVFAIRRLEVTNGAIERDALDADPMRLGGITMKTDLEPERPGVYAFNAGIDRAPIVRLRAEAAFDIDDVLLDVRSLDLEIQLDTDTYGSLPSELQKVLRSHEIKGDLELALAGRIPLESPERSEVDVSLLLKDGYATIDDYAFPVHEMAAAMAMAGRRMHLTDFRIASADTSIEADATMAALGRLPGRLDVTVKDLHLEHLLRPEPGKPPRFSGRTNSTFHLEAEFAALTETALGTGEVSVTDGSLGGVRLIRDLVNVIVPKSKSDEAPKGRDRGTAQYELVGTELRVRNAQVIAGWVAARGDGEIRFEAQRVNFRVNAGPLERVQAALGEFGNIFGALTDRLVTYHVVGPFDDVKVEVKPLGIGASADK